MYSDNSLLRRSKVVMHSACIPITLSAPCSQEVHKFGNGTCKKTLRDQQSKTSQQHRQGVWFVKTTLLRKPVDVSLSGPDALEALA